ncbi:MAG: GNAT family N-acetyltransferase [bacterium]
MTGYMHPGYADSLSEFGDPKELPRCGGWLLERQIPGVADQDAMGCYPLFACRDWSRLHLDLEDIGNGIVSLSLVTDPFGDYDTSYLHQCFEDVVIPFKEHFIIDLERPADTFVCSHHRRNVAQALASVEVERIQKPTEFLDDWVALYAALIERHDIDGILAFSRSAFNEQLRVPGIAAFRAMAEGETVSMLLWYVQGDVGYYHLGASSALGYNLCASFALFWTAIERFASSGLKWLDLGAGAGIGSEASDGLSRFKRGWCTDTRTAYFCGRIFDRARYAEIVRRKGISPSSYFPAYRKGEFG